MYFDFKKDRRSMTFIAKLYKIKLIPKERIARKAVCDIVDNLMKENNKTDTRFRNIKSFITYYDNKTGSITLKAVAINMRLNARWGYREIGSWGYNNSRFVRQNGLFIQEWFKNNEISKFYDMKVDRVYNLSTEWKLEESTEKQFEDLNYYDIAPKLVKYFKDDRFWHKYHYVKIKNKRYFDISLPNFMYTFNMNISDYLYKYRWKTFEDLSREFPIDLYKRKMSGSDMKGLIERAEMEFQFSRKENELVTFTKQLTIRGLFNISTAEWSIINHRIKYYDNEEEYNGFKHNLHYSSYENYSKDIIDHYIWLSDLFNFTGYDQIILKGE